MESKPNYARNHHYLSQCYLRGFTSGHGKKSKLSVFDFKEHKYFETIPRNVGGIRDFNRIDVEGFPQDFVESGYSELENKAAQSLKKVSEGADFDNDNKNNILNLLALLAARSPEKREQWRKFNSQIAEVIMDLTLGTEERWNSQIDQVRASGKYVNENVSYEDMKKFVNDKQYTIEVARERHIHMEMLAMDTILPLLHSRKWVVIRATDESGPFITSDNPVVLLWKDPESIPAFYRNSPGYGLRGTQIFFSVSSSVTIVGEFEGEPDVIEADRNFVANINSIFLNKFHKQIYAPKLTFSFIGLEGNLLEGRHLLNSL